jgi:hypothetical protein
VINACIGVPECRLALFRPAPTFKGVYAKLRLAISQIVQEKELVNSLAHFHKDDYHHEYDKEYYQH